MKNKKALIITISVIVIVAVAVAILVNIVLGQATKKIQEEGKIYETLEIALDNGEKVETEYYNFEDAFFVKVPKDFKQMDEETIKVKYPNPNPPTYVFTNEATTMNVAISITNDELKNNQIKAYLETLKAMCANYEEVTTNLFVRDGRNIGEISFVSPGVDTNIHNHMIVFSNNGKQAIVTFNCTKELQPNYQKLGDFVTNSIMFPVEQ